MSSIDKCTDPTNEMRAQNKALERSPEYQRILPEVMKEVYTLFVKERIVSLERLAETEGLFGYDSYFPNDDLPWEQTPIERKMNKPSFLIDTAKSYLPHDPAHAAEVLSQIGSCHKIWALQKQILKRNTALHGTLLQNFIQRSNMISLDLRE